MAAQPTDKAEIRFYDAVATPATEVVPQLHDGERKVAVHCRIMEWTPERMVSHTYYDPGLVLPRHSHASDSLIYILDGEVTIGLACEEVDADTPRARDYLRSRGVDPHDALVVREAIVEPARIVVVRRDRSGGPAVLCEE